MDSTAGLQLMGRTATLSWYGPKGEVHQQVTVAGVACAQGAVIEL